MSAVRTLDRPVLAASEPQRAPSPVAVAAAAGIRAAVTAVSGLLLVVGLALLLWAVTPASGTTPTPVLRGGVAAFAAAHLLPVSIGGAVLTLPPMLLTLVFVGLLAAGAVRGRVTPDGSAQEALAAVVAAGVYTGVVLASAALFAPAGSVDLTDGWRVGVLALVATVIGTAVRGSAWRAAWMTTVPGWLQVGVRTGTAGAALLVAGGAVALVVGVVTSFGTASALTDLAAPSAGDGFGMALLGLAFIPNAVLAGTGYATGVGFQVGAGTYSPIGTHAVDLPAVPLLVVVPPTGGPSVVGLTLLVVPLLAALLVGWAVVRRVRTRLDRILACAVAGGSAGLVVALLAAAAGGGISGSAWAHLGVPALLFGPVVAVEVALPAAAVAAAAGWSRVPWTHPAPAAGVLEVTEPDDDPTEIDDRSGIDEAAAGALDADADEYDDRDDEDNGLIIWDSTDEDDELATDELATDELEDDNTENDGTEAEIPEDDDTGADAADQLDDSTDTGAGDTAVDPEAPAANDAGVGRGQAALDARVAQALDAQRLVRDSREQ